MAPLLFAPLLHRLASQGAEVAAETLWPTRCAVCDAPGSLLCASCAAQLPFIDAIRACPRCGAPYGTIQCTECSGTRLTAAGYTALPLDALASAVVLDERSRRLVTTFKDRSEARLAPVIAALMAPYAHPSWIRARPVVTSIPASHQARARRGFDHGELVGHALAEALGLPFRQLLRAPAGRDQRKLGRQERFRNLQQAVSLAPGAVAPRAVILADDVCTTGATLYAAAEALRRSGSERVFGLSFARTWD